MSRMSATLYAAWQAIFAVDAAAVGLIVLSVVAVGVVAPIKDPSGRLTAVERWMARHLPSRGSVFELAEPPSTPAAAAFVMRSRSFAEQCWRANRGVFFTARVSARCALAAATANVLLAVVAVIGFNASVGWIDFAFLALFTTALAVVLQAMAEGRRWQRCAPFEAQLARLIAGCSEPQYHSWSAALRRATLLEELFISRFNAGAPSPSTTLSRERWLRQITPWVELVATGKLRRGQGNATAQQWLAETAEAAVKVLHARPKWKQTVPDALQRARSWNSLLRAGCLLALVLVGAATYFLLLLVGELHSEAPQQFTFSWSAIVSPLTAVSSVVAAALTLYGFGRRIAQRLTAPV